jgi:hypothetical protein
MPGELRGDRHPTRYMSETSIATTPCPSCADTRAVPFFRVAATPVTCTSIFDSAEEARAVPCGPVALAVCTACGLIYNTAFDAARAQIGARYESSQAASAHFGAFARDLAQTWVERHALAGQTVLEIGCGQCDFLRLLLATGVERGIGIDPLAPASAPADGPRLEIQQRLFDTTTLDIEAKAAVCRHTLEHIDDVDGFLRALCRWAARDGERVVLFELPATERLLDERGFWDVYYEHCNYFTAPSLTHAFERAGFEVLRCEPTFGDQYLLLEARAASTHAPPPPCRGVADIVLGCREFAREVAAAVDRCERRLRAMSAAGGPIVLWQGAAKTVGFLAAIPASDRVHCAVDLNAQRHGRYLPGSGLAVVAPEMLRALRPAHIVLMNPAYRAEVQAMLDGLGVAARLITVVELCGDGSAPDVSASI